MIKTILLLNPVYVTLFWALVLTLENRKQQVPKLFLGRFMFVAFVLYLSHFFIFQGNLMSICISTAYTHWHLCWFTHFTIYM